jgi:phosphoribosylformylglycinamidine synthase I
MRVPVLVLHAPGTNRDREAALAVEAAGGSATIRTLTDLGAAPGSLLDHRMFVVPGGFSFGDDLGAGKVFALELERRFGDAIREFLALGRPVLGICNGFQALVKAGFLPGEPAGVARRTTLSRNARAQFECRWVRLLPNPKSPCVFTREITEPLACVVAHGEGRVLFSDAAARAHVADHHLAALRYEPTPGADDGYPGNPNGSTDHIAGLTNAAGTVLGLMPHPEDHIFPHQHPLFHRGGPGGKPGSESGLALFRGGVRYAGAL